MALGGNNSPDNAIAADGVLRHMKLEFPMYRSTIWHEHWSFHVLATHTPPSCIQARCACLPVQWVQETRSSGHCSYQEVRTEANGHS